MVLRFANVLFMMSLVLCTSGDPSQLANVGYLLSGYNVFKGNPLPGNSAGVDPGFTTSIYKSVFSTGKTDDGRHLIPDHMHIKNNVGCAVSFASEVTFKQSDYQKTLGVSVSADITLPQYGASFSASTDYKSFTQHTSSDKLKMVSSTAECAVYTGGVDAFTPPDFTDNFHTGMSNLPNEYGNGESYFDFIDVFGTHMIEKVTMGARFGFTSYFDEESSKKIEETGVSVATAAKYEGIVRAGGSVNTTVSKKAQEEFSQTAQHEGQITLGAKPTTTDATKWANNAIDEPMPIKYTLKTICAVLTDTTLATNCRAAVKEYCEKRLKVQHQVASCDSPEDGAFQCLWASDCGAGPTYHCVNNKCQKDPPAAPDIHSNDVVYLKHVGSGEYFKDVKAAGARKDWPAGRLGDPRGTFQLRLENPFGTIHGDGQTLLRIRSQTTTNAGYDFMYASEQGGIYFDQDDQTNDKQWWKLWKVPDGTPTSDDIVRVNSIVRFENKFAPNTFLQKYQQDWVYSLEGKDNWQIVLASEPMEDPVVVT